MAKLYNIEDYNNRRKPNENKKPGLAEVFDISNHIRWQGKHEVPEATPIGPGVFFTP